MPGEAGQCAADYCHDRPNNKPINVTFYIYDKKELMVNTFLHKYKCVPGSSRKGERTYLLNVGDNFQLLLLLY